jgi:hypothetical protein
MIPPKKPRARAIVSWMGRQAYVLLLNFQHFYSEKRARHDDGSLGSARLGVDQ